VAQRLGQHIARPIHQALIALTSVVVAHKDIDTVLLQQFQKLLRLSAAAANRVDFHAAASHMIKPRQT
jgi:hypothetical protein